jgi:hypothetical protein
MKLIELTKCKFAKVSNTDFEFINSFNWHFASGYAARRKNSKSIYMHRVIVGIPIGKEVDHINGDKLDNRRSNLRICTHLENHHNEKRVNTKTGFKGIYLYKNKYGWSKWHARISVNDVYISLGYFKDKIDAALAYNKAAKKYYGELANLNII